MNGRKNDVKPMKKTIIQIFAIILLFAASGNAQTCFDTTVLKRHLSYLASDELGGRYPETEGSLKAGDYILRHYAGCKLKALCGNGFQNFTFPKNWTAGDSNRAEMAGHELRVEQDYAPLDYFQTRKASLTANVVFARQSILESLDSNVIAGKWLMFHDDTAKNFRKKAFLGAMGKKAGGILLITGDIKPEISNILNIPASKSTDLGPVLCISEAVADSILMYSSPVGETGTVAMYSESSLTFSATTHFVQNHTGARNVVVVLEGSDPKLRSEYIVVGGHYDHLGTKNKVSKKTGKTEVRIYNGADDNASGTVGVMALAEKYSQLGKAPKRSIVFVNFDAEEEGLLGSAHFFDSTLHISPSQVKAMINIDMIGRYTDEKGLTVIGIESMQEAKEIKKVIQKKSPLKILFPKRSVLFAGSDHVNFYKHQIPVLFFGTSVHTDYHKPSDTVEKINFKDMQEILAAIDRVVNNLANRRKNLTFKELEF